MTVLRDPGLVHDDGLRDARRHHERLRDRIAEGLRGRIADEQLITAGPEHKVRVPVAGDREWRFIFDRQQQGGVGQSADGDPGDVLDLGGPGRPGGAAGPGPGGTEPGTVEYEVELDMDEVEEHLFRRLGLPRLAPRARQETEVESIVWDDRARRGPLLDKKATLRANLRRNASAGHAGIGDLDRDDTRYLTYREQLRPATKAVVFLVMDVSGSMGPFEKGIARLFFWWASRFLRRRYTTCELVFVAHHTEAVECTEAQFFTRVESGGTRCSSAYELVLDLQRARYPETEWNVFVVHCSDGDNAPDDNARLVALVREAASVANLVGYVQIERHQRYSWGGPHLHQVLAGAAIEGVVSAVVTKDDEIWAALQRVFAPSPEDLAA